MDCLHGLRMDLLSDPQVDDRGLYAHRQLFLGRKEIMGRAQGFLPYVTWPALSGTPPLKQSQQFPHNASFETEVNLYVLLAWV